ncbi:hypothetical protein MKW94_000758 [Papaver nudicaule]|uniref:NPF family transporter n=1 Tax=Papaver nudicaule TaxID=74823 RepID=A0AA41V4X3_PAPNU|nr:hypothetical protein [Papaver nudicaule]
MQDNIRVPLLNFAHGHDEFGHMDTPVEKEAPKGGWKSSIYIIGVEVAERFAYYGTSGNLITYLNNVLGESTATAAKNVNVWSGVATLLPLLGAFMADSFLGRFNTILISSIIYIMGLIMLTISVSVVRLKYQHILFFLSLYLVAIGEGGHKPCVLTFGADQFDEDKPEEKKAKSSFFNWWYFGICGGAAAGMLIVFYVQDYVGWAVGFGIPSLAMAFALVLFLIGSRSYRQLLPKGSPVVGVVQVFAAAYSKRHLSISKDGHEICNQDVREIGTASEGRTLTHTDQFRCLDKAAIIDDVDILNNTRNEWRLCSTTQVEEVKLLVRLIPIWFSSLMYAVTLAQGGTFFTKQGSTMERAISPKFHIPPASLQVTPGLVVMFTIPFYDRVFVRTVRNWTGIRSGITMLQRIGIGMFISITYMVIAALVEAKRVKIATEHGLLDLPQVTVPMSIWWLLPQYIVQGISDVFIIVGLQELFYDQMPEAMRSIGSAVYLSVYGVGSLTSSVIISLVQVVSSRCGDEWLGNNLNRAHLDYYYWLLAGLNILWFCLFLVVSKCFVYKKVNGDDLLIP